MKRGMASVVAYSMIAVLVEVPIWGDTEHDHAQASTESLEACSGVGPCSHQSVDFKIFCPSSSSATLCVNDTYIDGGEDGYIITISTYPGICLNGPNGWYCFWNPQNFTVQHALSVNV
jgi:hypothetical protein